MSEPFSNISVNFNGKAGYSLVITDIETQSLKSYGESKNVTNYEYEVQENENKRQVLILKPEYLSAFIQDMKNIMKYNNSSQYINDTTKRVYNPKLKGV